MIKEEILFRIRKLRVREVVSLISGLILLSLVLALIFSTTDARWWVGIPIYLGGGYLIGFWFERDKELRNLRKKTIL